MCGTIPPPYLFIGITLVLIIPKRRSCELLSWKRYERPEMLCSNRNPESKLWAKLGFSVSEGY
jgi:hypothetical protein